MQSTRRNGTTGVYSLFIDEFTDHCHCLDFNLRILNGQKERMKNRDDLRRDELTRGRPATWTVDRAGWWSVKTRRKHWSKRKDCESSHLRNRLHSWLKSLSYPWETHWFSPLQKQRFISSLAFAPRHWSNHSCRKHQQPWALRRGLPMTIRRHSNDPSSDQSLLLPVELVLRLIHQRIDLF